jgi:transcription initiation factor TFIIA large subunit
MQRIPQLDGPSTTSSQEDESGSSDGSPSPPSKSVPLPSIKKAPAVITHTPSLQDDDDAIIGSDLDDTDDDDNGDQDDDDVEGGSKVLCTYDRVRHQVLQSLPWQ